MGKRVHRKILRRLLQALIVLVAAVGAVLWQLDRELPRFARVRLERALSQGVLSFRFDHASLNLFRGINDEQFYVICLDSSRTLLGCEKICEGSVNEVYIYPRLVVKAVLKYNSSSVYLTHNHPSCSVVPSWQDYEITLKISDALSHIGVAVKEHIVVGGMETIGVMNAYAKEKNS